MKPPPSPNASPARLAKYKVVSDLPKRLSVTEDELDLLENELADFIEELLQTERG